MDKLDDTMFMIDVCERFGYTYNEYLDLPVWFVELLREKARIDSIKARQARRK